MQKVSENIEGYAWH